MGGNPLRKMESAALYAQLGRLIESTPPLAVPIPHLKDQYYPLTQDQMMWLGRAESLVSESLGLTGDIEFKSIMQKFDRYRPWAATEIAKIMYRALAQIEMELPTPATGAFIPTGNAFDAVKAVQRIFATATSDLLVVDPYLDAKFFTDFAELIPEGISVRLLADGAGKISTLNSPLIAWRKQYGTTRPTNVRVAQSRTLHDRLIATNGKRVWTIGQSFNALATRAPTSFVEADSETAKLKFEAYGKIWDAAEELKQA
jgi:hypothetical protein